MNLHYFGVFFYFSIDRGNILRVVEVSHVLLLTIALFLAYISPGDNPFCKGVARDRLNLSDLRSDG